MWQSASPIPTHHMKISVSYLSQLTLIAQVSSGEARLMGAADSYHWRPGSWHEGSLEKSHCALWPEHWSSERAACGSSPGSAGFPHLHTTACHRWCQHKYMNNTLEEIKSKQESKVSFIWTSLTCRVWPHQVLLQLPVEKDGIVINHCIRNGSFSDSWQRNW